MHALAVLAFVMRPKANIETRQKTWRRCLLDICRPHDVATCTPRPQTVARLQRRRRRDQHLPLRLGSGDMFKDGNVCSLRDPPQISNLHRAGSHARCSKESRINRVAEMISVAIEPREDIAVEFRIHIYPVSGSRETLILTHDLV